jgi:clathrin heavy chain
MAEGKQGISSLQNLLLQAEQSALQLTCSKELGDIVCLHDMTLILNIYLQVGVPNKVIACFAETGQTEKIALYSKKVSYRPDYVALLQHVMRTNPEKGAEFATQLMNDEMGPLVDVECVRIRILAHS